MFAHQRFLGTSHDDSQLQVIESLETVEVPHRPQQGISSGFRKNRRQQTKAEEVHVMHSDLGPIQTFSFTHSPTHLEKNTRSIYSR